MLLTWNAFNRRRIVFLIQQRNGQAHTKVKKSDCYDREDTIHSDRLTNGKTDRQVERQIDEWTDRQTGKKNEWISGCTQKQLNESAIRQTEKGIQISL